MIRTGNGRKDGPRLAAAAAADNNNDNDDNTTSTATTTTTATPGGHNIHTEVALSHKIDGLIKDHTCFFGLLSLSGSKKKTGLKRGKIRL